jgi:predicted PurR-regulated permease PerM
LKTRVALTVLAVAAAIVLLRYMQEVCVPMALAVLLFYALDRPVDWLQRLHVPRVLGAALVLGLFAGSLAGVGYVVQDQARAVVDRLPESARKLRQIMRSSPTAQPGALEKVDEAAKELQEDPAPVRRNVMRVQVEEPPFKVGDYLWWGSMNAVTFANQVVMILFLSYFMLVSDDLFKRKIVEIAPTLTRKKVSLQILDEIASQIERFLVIQLMMSAVVAAVTATALWWLGLEQALFWGIVAGVFNSIPYYGPLLVSVMLSAVGFIQFGTLGMTAAVAGVALLVTTLEGFLLTPALMGRAARINQVSMFAGLLFWTWMWGVWGLLLAVPLMMVLKVVSDRVEGLEPIGRFLGE